MNPPDRSDRFGSLDVLRGLAALSVTVFHCVNSHPDVTASPVGRILLYGWSGVFLFFPVSGYCICAATDRHENASPRRFIARRWCRIYPPYWASIVVTLAVALAALSFNRASLSDLALPAYLWVGVLTLTQVFTASADALNPVYWSLGYEEQFYLVMAAGLLLPRAGRAWLIAGTACVAAIYLAIPALQVRGLFLNYWLCFATGCAVYFWTRTGERAQATIVMAVAAATAAWHADAALAISLGCAVAMIQLARVDARIVQSRVAGPLLALGAISYSLYLTHVPIGGRVVNLLVRFDTPLWLAGAVALLASLGVAVVFYSLVERRFLPAASASPERAASAGLPIRTTAPGYANP